MEDAEAGQFDYKICCLLGNHYEAVMLTSFRLMLRVRQQRIGRHGQITHEKRSRTPEQNVSFADHRFGSVIVITFAEEML